LDEDNEAVRVVDIKYIIKDGIFYDTKKLLKDIKNSRWSYIKEEVISCYFL